MSTFANLKLVEFKSCGEFLKEERSNASNVIVLVDSTVLPLITKLISQPFLSLTCGEGIKTFHGLETILTFFAKQRLERNGVVIAIGGGSLLDVAGFAASIWKRGCRTINIPTTLLSMVDASIGGKTGINFAGTKNLVGTFHEPELVICDVSFLSSLPDSEVRSGLAEVVKSACLGDLMLFNHLEHFQKLFDPTYVVKASLEVKSQIVQADPFEKGVRKLLNFGHTVGHAVELIHKEPHGYAVARGMVCECKVAAHLGLINEEIVNRIIALLKALSLPTTLEVDPSKIFVPLQQDKKFNKGLISLAVPSPLGSATLKEISIQELYEVIQISN